MARRGCIAHEAGLPTEAQQLKVSAERSALDGRSQSERMCRVDRFLCTHCVRGQLQFLRPSCIGNSTQRQKARTELLPVLCPAQVARQASEDVPGFSAEMLSMIGQQPGGSRDHARRCIRVSLEACEDPVQQGRYDLDGSGRDQPRRKRQHSIRMRLPQGRTVIVAEQLVTNRTLYGQDRLHAKPQKPHPSHCLGVIIAGAEELQCFFRAAAIDLDPGIRWDSTAWFSIRFRIMPSPLGRDSMSLAEPSQDLRQKVQGKPHLQQLVAVGRPVVTASSRARPGVFIEEQDLRIPWQQVLALSRDSPEDPGAIVQAEALSSAGRLTQKSSVDHHERTTFFLRRLPSAKDHTG